MVTGHKGYKIENIIANQSNITVIFLHIEGYIGHRRHGSATILLSDDLGGFHFDINGLVMEQQDDTTDVRRAQFAQKRSRSLVR